MATITKLIHIFYSAHKQQSLCFQALASNGVYLCTKVADFRTELGLTFCKGSNCAKCT